MKEIIGAEAAKLAGLQIDTLQKVRSNQITLGQWERFNNLSPGDREARFGDFEKPKPESPIEPTEKFSLFVDLGHIKVPDNYKDATQLDSFREKNREKFDRYCSGITDANFAATTKFVPGSTLRVRIFKQIVPGTTTSEERMVFLRSWGAVLAGPQGASLVFEQRGHELPRNYWYTSFGKKHALVSRIFRDLDGCCNFLLTDFDSEWDDRYCLLGLFEI